MHVDRKWVADRLRAAGFRSQAAFAEAIGLTASKFSNVLSGKRRLQTSELQAISSALKLPLAQLLEAFNIEWRVADSFIQPLAGYIVDGGLVELLGVAEPPIEIETFISPVIYFEGNYVVVKTDNLRPRYKRGDVIASSSLLIDEPEEGWFYDGDIAEYIGEEVIARLTNGPAYIGVLHAGSREKRYVLVSADPAVPPLLDVEIRWVADVEFIIPSPTLRAALR